MAEILIKNMEMPKACGDCRFAVNAYGSLTEGKCAVLGYGVTYLNKRCDACPLVEVPPHGDLIDRSKLVIHGWIYDDGELQEHADYYDVTEVQNAPTILEASDGYTN